MSRRKFALQSTRNERKQSTLSSGVGRLEKATMSFITLRAAKGAIWSVNATLHFYSLCLICKSKRVRVALSELHSVYSN